MPGTIGRQSVGGLVLSAALLVLSAWVSSDDARVAADPPSANKPALSDADRKKLLAERDRFDKESTDLQTQGRYAEAIAAAQKMLAIERRVFGDVADDVAGSLERIAQCSLGRDDFTSARKALAEQQSILSKLYGPGDWRVAKARFAVLDVETRSRSTPQQRRLLVQADQATSQVVALYRKGDFRRAIGIAKQAADIRRRVLGEQHPDTATSLHNLAGLYYLMGDYAKAEPLYRQALEINKKVLGENHPSTATGLHSLGLLYKSMGDYAKAEARYRQALEIRKKVLGENHPETATSLNNLAP
jgi:tetratricopeptide (TPR) repeat protein